MNHGELYKLTQGIANLEAGVLSPVIVDGSIGVGGKGPADLELEGVASPHHRTKADGDEEEEKASCSH